MISAYMANGGWPSSLVYLTERGGIDRSLGTKIYYDTFFDRRTSVYSKDLAEVAIRRRLDDVSLLFLFSV